MAMTHCHFSNNARQHKALLGSQADKQLVREAKAIKDKDEHCHFLKMNVRRERNMIERDKVKRMRCYAATIFNTAHSQIDNPNPTRSTSHNELPLATDRSDAVRDHIRRHLLPAGDT